jgi:hypothetical protein
MSKLRIITIISSLILALALGFVLVKGQIFWPAMLVYLFHAILAVYFLGVLVSNQQYKEDAAAKIERVASAILFSYAFFLQMIYAPLARYFFGSLIAEKFFFSDVMALLLFLFFLFLFVTSSLVLNSFSRSGFWPQLSVFNNSTAYFVSRNLFLAALLLIIFLYWQMPFIIITV